MTLSSVSLMQSRIPPAQRRDSGSCGPLPMAYSPDTHLRGGNSRGVEESDRAEIAAGGAAAGQTGPPAPPSVRVRPGQRDPDAAADRPGDRARPARLLPQPGLQGP